MRPRRPRWQQAGFVKKLVCDRCGFRAKHSAQITVYHIDGNLNNADLVNLRCICRNCEIAVSKRDLPWLPGDLEPDL